MQEVLMAVSTVSRRSGQLSLLARPQCNPQWTDLSSDVQQEIVEVLQALERQPYDIVFLDVQMPEMDGYEAARQLRRRWTDTERPRIIAMTGNAMQGDREMCLKAGMDDYIAKPLRVEELRASLERWGHRP
jgi:CheY-like chemotaxis protein